MPSDSPASLTITHAGVSGRAMSTLPPPLLIIWHSRTGASEAMARSAADGAGDAARILRCQDVSATDMLAAAGYLFCGPENLAALSGAMKEMLDRLYYPLLGQIEGRAYASIITAGSDGSGAQRQLDRILAGWRLRRVAEPLIANVGAQSQEEILREKRMPPALLAISRDLGAALREGLTQGVF
jgi:hypothetical protein